MELGYTIPYTGITLLRLTLALLILVIGVVLSKIIAWLFGKSIIKLSLPPLLEIFLQRFFRMFLYIIVILIAVGSLGVEVSSAII